MYSGLCENDSFRAGDRAALSKNSVNGAMFLHRINPEHLIEGPYEDVWGLGHEDRLLRHRLLTSLVLVISYPVANELSVNVPILPCRRPGGVVPTPLRSCLLGFCLLSKYGSPTTIPIRTKPKPLKRALLFAKHYYSKK